MKKDYKSVPLGFDRTQLYKEYCEPIIQRQSAMKTAISLMTAHDLKWSMSDIMLLTTRLTQWMETGDDTWVKRMDQYFKLKDDEKLNQLLK